MIIFIGLTLLIVIGLFLLYNDREWGTGAAGVFLMVFPSIFLIICLVSLITYPIEVKSNINKFLATEATTEAARENGVDVENAAIQHKIIESNQWLVKEQYYNSTMFGLWIPNEVDNLKQMR